MAFAIGTVPPFAGPASGLGEPSVSPPGWLSWWRRLTARARRRSADHAERRQSVRYRCVVPVVCQSVNCSSPVADTFPCHDLSLGGLALHVLCRLDPGTLLTVRLPGRGRHAPPTRLLLVRHAQPRAEGDWLVGGTFYTDLTDDDLDVLRRHQPISPP